MVLSVLEDDRNVPRDQLMSLSHERQMLLCCVSCPHSASREAVGKEAHVAPFSFLVTFVLVSFSCPSSPSAMVVSLTIPTQTVNGLRHTHTRTAMEP